MSYQPPPNGWRTFLIMWGTQSVSAFGSALTFFALNIWLTQTLYPLPEQKPQLAWAISAVGIAFALPTVFGAPLAGAWADRHDRKRIMMAMDFANGVLSLVTALLVMAGVLQLWMLLGIVACCRSSGRFTARRSTPHTPCSCQRSSLPRANGMMQTMWSLSGILSPAIAATIIAVPGLARQGVLGPGLQIVLGGFKDGASLAMLVDALTFFGAAAALIFLFVPSPKRTDLHGDRWSGEGQLVGRCQDGGLYIWHRRPLLWLLGTFTVANFVGGPMGVFEPLLVKFNLAADWTARGFTFETALATLGTVMAVGGVAGGLFISAWGGLKRRRVYGVVVALIVEGLAHDRAGPFVAGSS